MKNKKAKLLSILLSLSMLGTAPVYGEDFSDFSDNLVASDEADPEVSVSSDDTSQDSFQIEDPDSANEDSSFFSNEEAETTSDFASDESDINEQGFSDGEVSEEEIADTEIADETSIIDYANAAPRASIVEADIEIDPSITATCNSYSGRNLEYQNYTVWSSTVSSYLTTSPDGGLMRVQAGALDGTLLVEYYDSSYNYQRTVTVPLSLPVFGAFYESADNYYVLSGQNNTDHDDSVEVYHVTKYTKDWKALGSCGLFGANTAYPFDAGSARMVINGNYLFVRTCHKMYNGHQANVTFSVDTSSMNIVDKFTGVWNTSNGYVSHSFNQFIQVDNGTLLGVDHGEGYPTALVLSKYVSDISSGNFQSGIATPCKSLTFMSLVNDTSIHYNYTGASLGAFEYSDSAYLIAGTKDTDSTATTRDVFITSMDKSSGETFTHFYSNYAGTDDSALTPHLVKTGNNSFILLWSNQGYVYYTAVDGTGQQVGTTHKMAGNLSDCAPIVSNGKAIWYTWKNQFNTFYEISLNDLSSNHAARIENGHKYNYADKAENALLTGTCRVCGYQKQFSVPVELDVQKKDASNTFYQEMKEIYQMEPGGTADILWYSYFASANKDYDQITNWKISSSDESIVSVEQTGKNTCTITALKPGFATFTIQEKTNPSAVFTAKIYVNMISDDTASWYLPSSYFVFDGTEHKPSVHLKVNNKLLTEGTDYEITYDGDLINAGTVKLTVTGIGVYTGSVETTYNIQKLSMSNASFSVAPAYYTGSEVTPEVTVTHSGKTLVKDRDFIVTYHNNIEPSSYYNSPWVGIDGIGNYQGYVTKSFTINRADISSCTVTLSDESLTYTGSSLRPTVTVKNGDKELTLNQDYYVSYRNNWNAGTASVIVNGSGNYTGSVTKDFQIIPADISNYEVTLYNDSFDYDGTAKEQRYVRLYSGTRWLSEDTDFTVTYANNVNAGTASAILTGTGNYTGSVTKDFTIKPLDISRYSASLSQYSYTSDGTEKCPDVTVTYGDKTLAAGTDFTVSYKDNVKEGTATVTITGAGNYTGIINTTFTITAAPDKDDSDAGKDNPGKDDSGKDDSGKDDSGKDDSGKDDSGKGDSGKDDSGKDDSGKNDSGKDDSGKDNSGKDDSGKDNSGKNDSDKGNQNSSTPGNNNNNNNGNTSGNNDQNNNGQNNNNTNNNNNNQNNSSNNEANNDTAITPVPAVINASDITLTKSKKKANIITSIESDGKVSLKSSNTKVVKISGTKVIPVNPGKANVTITVAAGTRYAAASKTVTITVIPAKTSLRSVKSKTAKQATVTWKKAKSISGYQISYSQNSSMKKAKALTVKGSATRATLKKLVSKKKYYVRIRTYKVVSGKKYYSKWSSKKSVKIR